MQFEVITKMLERFFSFMQLFGRQLIAADLGLLVSW